MPRELERFRQGRLKHSVSSAFRRLELDLYIFVHVILKLHGGVNHAGSCVMVTDLRRNFPSRKP